jgi:hypothetical protein
MKKFILALILSLSTLFTIAQSGWQSGNYYMYQGQTTEQCGSTYVLQDNWGYSYYYQDCRILRWETRQYSGYVYVWVNGYWTTQWYNGYTWYCYWSPWYRKRVW